MNNQDYEKAKAECWKAFIIAADKIITPRDAFSFSFDRAYALGKQENDADTVISGWVARDNNGKLYIYSDKPERYNKGLRWVMGYAFLPLSSDLFPDLTWESDPEPVEIILKRKKK